MSQQKLVLPAGWWGVIPSLTLLGIFVLYPFLQLLQISSLKWDGVVAGESIGLGNYTRLLSDGDLGRSILTTVILALCVLPLFVGLAATIAVELEGTRFERLIKAILFLPGLWTVGASAIGWYTLYAPDYGIIATITSGAVALPWGDQGWAALTLVGAFIIWQNIGYGVLVISAGLKSIPQETLEAARVDGASEHQVRWKIVIPLLRPSLTFLAVIGGLYALQSYTAVFLLTRGGPFGSTRVLGYFLYETAFERFEFGYGAALSMCALALAFTFAALQARALRGSEQ
ncbi:MAG: carbohydrate ABC transporter permease [Deinococcales bacterium]